MNVSAQYHLMPFGNASYFQNVQPGVSYPLSRTDDLGDRSFGGSEQRAEKDPQAYKFYVVSDDGDSVYTRRKQMESIHARQKGAMVDLYA